MGENSAEVLLAEISTKMDRLLGAIAIQGKDRSSQIDTLLNLGFSSPFISSLVGISDRAVRMRKVQGKKSLRSKKK